MTSNSADPVWNAVVELMLPLGPVQEQRSRYGDKPALSVTATREIAHLEAPGVVDVRITRACRRRLSPAYVDDPRVQRRRSDWIELHLTTSADVDAMRELLTAVVQGNLR